MQISVRLAVLGLLLAFAAAQPVTKCSSCGNSNFPTPSACVVNGNRIDAQAKGCCADAPAVKLLTRLLDVLEKDSYKEVTIGDKEGNPPFGGAILGNYPDKDYPLVLTGHNTVFSEHTPVFHGEVKAINFFFQKPADKRIPADDVIFLATHQPCAICMSSLAFAGFRRIFYAFGYDDGMNDAQNRAATAGGILDPTLIETTFGNKCAMFNYTNGLNTYIPIKSALEMSACGDQKVQGQMDALRKRYVTIKAMYRELGDRFAKRMAVADNNPNTAGLEVLSSNCKGCLPFPRAECRQHRH